MAMAMVKSWTSFFDFSLCRVSHVERLSSLDPKPPLLGTLVPLCFVVLERWILHIRHLRLSRSGARLYMSSSRLIGYLEQGPKRQPSIWNRPSTLEQR